MDVIEGCFCVGRVVWIQSINEKPKAIEREDGGRNVPTIFYNFNFGSCSVIIQDGGCSWGCVGDDK